MLEYLVLVVSLILATVTLYRRLFSPLAKIPGPWHSQFSDLYLMFKEFTSQRRTYIHALHQKYGPAVRLGPNEVSFTSKSAVKEIYSSGGSGYDKTEFYTLFTQFNTRTMFSTLGKVDHSQKKRYIAGQYANTNIMRPDVVGGIQERARAFIKQCKETLGQSVDVYVYLHCFALDCAAHHLFHPRGTHSIEGGEDFEVMEEQSYHNSIKGNFAQYRWPGLTDVLNRIMQPRPSPLANQYVLDSCKQPNPAKESLLFKLQNSKESFQPIQTAAECMDHLAAGIDTTGDGLTFLMHQLSLPESYQIQEKLFQELNERQNPNLDELPYLDAVIKESLRCFPPIPMSQPRYAPSGGCSLDGYFIPGGTIVSCQSWSVHRLNEDVFVEGAKFRPERWLEDPARTAQMNRLFFAFGAGGRGCTGRHLAMAEMKCLLKEIYSKFRTRIAEDMRGSMELSDQIISSRPLDQTCKLVFEPIEIV